MSKKTLIEVRTNTNFAVDYETLSLSPQVELIMLFLEPKYEIKGKGIYKGAQLNEFRVKTDAEGIAGIIGQLQVFTNTTAHIQQYERGNEHRYKVIKD